MRMTEAVSIKDVFEELKKIERNMATKVELEALSNTIEVLSNPETMKQLIGSAEDIRKGRVKQVTSAKDLLCEF